MEPHLPVLAREAVEALALDPAGTYVDATFGAGGHTRSILAGLGPQGRVIALDADPAAAIYVPDDPRVTLVQANFRTLGAVLASAERPTVDGVLFDLGVSSMQLDDARRGFSFRGEGPLDMRLDPSRGQTAAEYLVAHDDDELADVIFRYGEERNARRIARAIKARRPRTTAELAAVVAGAVHVRGRRERIHPATRTFQALRIAVNDELDALREGLASAAGALRPGGRVAAISFHSLEDRIVKLRFRDDPRLRVLTRRPILPSEEEVRANARARSAKLRVAERVAEAAG